MSFPVPWPRPAQWIASRIASSCFRVTLGVWWSPWEITTGSFVSRNNLLRPHALLNQEQKFQWSQQTGYFPLPWVESRFGQQQLPGQTLLRGQQHWRGIALPPLLRQYMRENKILTLLKFKVPNRQPSNESAKAHIAKICLSFMFPQRQPLPFVYHP